MADQDTETAALGRASRIRAHWRERGYDVPVSVRRVVHGGSTVWIMDMPPMINGMPPKECRIAQGFSKQKRA